MKHQKMKLYSLGLTFLMVLVGFGQNYKGFVTPTQSDGLHKIMLTPDVRSASNENFAAIRIKDANGQEVPYVIMSNNDRTFSVFKPIEIVSKKAIKDSITTVVIENGTGQKQEQITVRIANTKIIKRYDVYGSDNAKDWFGLVSNRNLSYINKANQTFVEKTIHFPLNTYKFLRIDFNDKKSLPINVLEVGVYESKFFTQNPIEIKEYKQEILQLKDKKVTQLTFSATSPKKVNTIVFDIDTDFFLRRAKVIVNRTRKIKKRVETYSQVIRSFQLNSKNNNTFEFSNLNEKEFRIEIQNQDNPALAINNIRCYQKPLYLVANLKATEKYEMVLDTTLSAPSYDLVNFISNKIETIEEATIQGFSAIKAQEKEEKPTLFWQTSAFMWICIVLGGLLVIYFAIGLLKDIGKEESTAE